MQIRKTTFIQVIILLSVIIMVSSWTASDIYNSGEILQKFQAYHSNYPQEKIYVHHDKAYYALGNTLWFKVYIANSRSHLPQSLSSVIYVHLYDPQDSLIIFCS